MWAQKIPPRIPLSCLCFPFLPFLLPSSNYISWGQKLAAFYEEEEEMLRDNFSDHGSGAL